jgi:hypothetical protein
MPCPSGDCGKGGSAKKSTPGRGKTQTAKAGSKPSAPRMPKSTLTRRGPNYR